MKKLVIILMVYLSMFNVLGCSFKGDDQVRVPYDGNESSINAHFENDFSSLNCLNIQMHLDEMMVKNLISLYMTDILSKLSIENDISKIENYIRAFLEFRKSTLENCPSKYAPVCRQFVAAFEDAVAVGLQRKCDLEAELRLKS